jgi:hypothetical protein
VSPHGILSVVGVSGRASGENIGEEEGDELSGVGPDFDPTFAGQGDGGGWGGDLTKVRDGGEKEAGAPRICDRGGD